MIRFVKKEKYFVSHQIFCYYLQYRRSNIGFHITVLSPKVKAIYLDIKQIVVVTIAKHKKEEGKCEKPLLHSE